MLASDIRSLFLNNSFILPTFLFLWESYEPDCWENFENSSPLYKWEIFNYEGPHYILN